MEAFDYKLFIVLPFCFILIFFFNVWGKIKSGFYYNKSWLLSSNAFWFFWGPYLWWGKKSWGSVSPSELWMTQGHTATKQDNLWYNLMAEVLWIASSFWNAFASDSVMSSASAGQQYGSAWWEDHTAVCSSTGDWTSSCYSKLENVCSVPKLGL